MVGCSALALIWTLAFSEELEEEVLRMRSPRAKEISTTEMGMYNENQLAVLANLR